MVDLIKERNWKIRENPRDCDFRLIRDLFESNGKAT